MSMLNKRDNSIFDTCVEINPMGVNEPGLLGQQDCSGVNDALNQGCQDCRIVVELMMHLTRAARTAGL